MDIPAPFDNVTTLSGAVLVIVIMGVVIGFKTDVDIPTPSITLRFVTVPTDQLLFEDRSYATPFIVRVLELVTGVYPRMELMSDCVIGVALVTSPFAFTANLRAVLVL